MPPPARSELYRLADQWEQEDRRDERDLFPYHSVLDQILFHSDLRFQEYLQYRKDGPFHSRLLAWIRNAPDARHQRALLRTAKRLHFIDRSQFLSLHRDAYRRIVMPWLMSEETSEDDYFQDPEARLIRRLRDQYIASITESFSIHDFRHINDLAGIPKPAILGEKADEAEKRLPNPGRYPGVLILEDFVGSGKQATAVLDVVRRHFPPETRVLFVPLLIMESGLATMRADPRLAGVMIDPVSVVYSQECVHRAPVDGEPNDFEAIRSVVLATADRVMQRLDDLDDPPTDAFGYKDSGALVVTYQNAPNNTLPLIHHRAPQWVPLFRRVHHSRDGL